MLGNAALGNQTESRAVASNKTIGTAHLLYAEVAFFNAGIGEF
jgi:hypothetical protein